jgi:hypothetical protein
VLKVIALEQERLTCCFGQGVGKAVAEVQSSAMSAALSEIAVGFTCQTRLFFGNRLDDKLSLPKEIIKTPARYRAVAVSITTPAST